MFLASSEGYDHLIYRILAEQIYPPPKMLIFTLLYTKRQLIMFLPCDLTLVKIEKKNYSCNHFSEAKAACRRL